MQVFLGSIKRVLKNYNYRLIKKFKLMNLINLIYYLNQHKIKEEIIFRFKNPKILNVKFFY